MNTREEFLQELFEEKLVCSIIPQHLRLKTKAIMKRKGKAFAKEQVEKPIKKKTMSKAKESQKIVVMDEDGLQ